MSKHLILGDPHLGKITNGKPGIAGAFNSRIKDQIDILDWVLDQAIENSCYHIIITGDVFDDYKPNHTLIKIFIDWLAKCSVNQVAVDIIAGNHDMQRAGANYFSALDIINVINFPNIHVYKDISTVEFDNISFTYLPFRDRRGMSCETHDDAIKILKDKLLYEISEISISNLKVCVGHLTLHGALPVGDEIDDITNELMCPVDMFTGYDYVLMGHIHKPQIRNKNPYLAHIGSMDLSDFGEIDHVKKLILIDSDSETKISEIDIPTRPLVKIQIDIPEGQDPNDFTISKIDEINKKKSIKDSIIKLEIKLASKISENVNRPKIEEHIYNYGAYYICNFSESRNVIVVNVNKEDSIDNTMDVSKALELWSNSKISEEMKEGFLTEALEVYYQFQESVK